TLAAVFLLLGFLVGIPDFARNRSFLYGIRAEVLRHDLRLVVAFNFAIILVSQYFMGSAGVLGIMSGTVTAQDIEAALDASPFGVHGVKLLCGYLSIIMHRAAHPLKDARGLKAVLVLQALFIFLSSAKMGGMLFFVASLLTLEQGKNMATLLKGVVAALVLMAIFVITRLIRNPDMQIADVGAFLMTFVLGLYFGSPVVNTNYVMNHPEAGGKIIFLISHLVPQKLLPSTLKDAMVSFPDPTSPLGLIGATYAAYSFVGVAFGCMFAGFLVARLAPGHDKNPVKDLFLPFLLVASGFAIMYHHFFNLNFFWMPLLMAWAVSTRYFCKWKS
ncbi:MAG TPA: hypothetical protein H9903_08075, partial [Candidatus Aquabacterium excrementipullorum]|nr:hypothetical protein [Candidatus Aquabacterium excrementipullorum]